MEKMKVVLAYSGGLDTSVIIPWLIENYGCEVVAMVADVGQGDDYQAVKKKALKSGASRVFVEDLRAEFVTDYIFPTLKAGAVYESQYLLGTSFARPLIAKRQVEIAHKVGATAVSHGATGKGNDQVRFELTYFAMDPTLKIIVPWRDPKWKLLSREDALDYAAARNIPVTASKKKIYSEDANLWHLSHEGDELEDPANEPRDRVFTISQTIEKAPNKPEYVTLDFVRGVPVKVNGKALSPVNLIYALNTLGAKHAIGQIDIVENRLVGLKSRGVYECPAGTILYQAHTMLENMTLDRDTYHYKELVSKRYAELVYFGQWFTPLREALDAFVDSTQRNVTGRVRIKLYKGNCVPAGTTSPHSLYSVKLSSFTDDKALYNQQDATGFIRLFGLPLKTQAMLKRKNR
jgi:argininosuccinate synthase